MSFRRDFISKPIFSWARGVLPAMSDTEREALEAGDVWWDADLYNQIERAAGYTLGFHVSDWIVPLPDGLSLYEAMGLGTPGMYVIGALELAGAIAMFVPVLTGLAESTAADVRARRQIAAGYSVEELEQVLAPMAEDGKELAMENLPNDGSITGGTWPPPWFRPVSDIWL